MWSLQLDYPRSIEYGMSAGKVGGITGENVGAGTVAVGVRAVLFMDPRLL